MRLPAQTWDNLRMGMREDDNAKTCVTTTPKPIQLLRHLVKSSGVHVTVGSTYDNLANLPARPELLPRGTGPVCGLTGDVIYKVLPVIFQLQGAPTIHAPGTCLMTTGTRVT